MPIDNNTKKAKLQVAKRDSIILHPADSVMAQVQGIRHCEVVWMRKQSTGGTTIKINADEYIDTRTGEVKKFDKNDKKQRENLTETFRNLTALIRANFDAENEDKQLFITLTYKENMTDYKKLYTDWDVFYKRLKRQYSNHKFEYIAVAEPQGRGAWHLHVMLKSDKPLYMNNKTVTSVLWEHGTTDTQRLKSDDVGRYYVAYFTDLFGELGTKAKKKGARLHLYPVGMKFYRCSRGIVRPEKELMRYGDILKEYGAPEFRNTYEIKNEVGEVVQVVQREHFKKKKP